MRAPETRPPIWTVASAFRVTLVSLANVELELRRIETWTFVQLFLFFSLSFFPSFLSFFLLSLKNEKTQTADASSLYFRTIVCVGSMYDSTTSSNVMRSNDTKLYTFAGNINRYPLWRSIARTIPVIFIRWNSQFLLVSVYSVLL